MNAEKMRSSVLAYCEEVCPLKIHHAPIECGYLAFGYAEDDDVQMEAWMLFIGEDSPTITLYALSSEASWIAAYRILGLEARDAVAAEKRETERVRTSLNHAIAIKNEQIQKRLIESNADRNDLEAIIDHERTRNTALVEALEWIKQEHGYRYTYGDGFGNVVEKRINSVGVAVDNALTANTEKGGANE